MARAAAVPVVLDLEVRRRLERVAGSARAEVRAVIPRIVLAAAGGASNPAVAREVGVSVNTVRARRGRFALLGEAGLSDARRSGRPCIYGPHNSTAKPYRWTYDGSPLKAA